MFSISPAKEWAREPKQMKQTTQCSSCGAMLNLGSGSHAKVKCGNCGAVVEVPRESAPDPNQVPMMANEPALFFRFSCPKCSHKMECPFSSQGHAVACSECRQRILIPPIAQQSTRRQDRGPVERARELATARLPHSGFGIASFIIALALLGVEGIMWLVILGASARDAQPEAMFMRPHQTAPVFKFINLIVAPFALVGGGLGSVALLSQKANNQMFTFMGLVGNGAVVLAVIMAYSILDTIAT
jgi:LSD1 subclass zinc finger protein